MSVHMDPLNFDACSETNDSMQNNDDSEISNQINESSFANLLDVHGGLSCMFCKLDFHGLDKRSIAQHVRQCHQLFFPVDEPTVKNRPKDDSTGFSFFTGKRVIASHDEMDHDNSSFEFDNISEVSGSPHPVETSFKRQRPTVDSECKKDEWVEIK